MTKSKDLHETKALKRDNLNRMIFMKLVLLLSHGRPSYMKLKTNTRTLVATIILDIIWI